MKIERSKEWWLERANQEGEHHVGAGLGINGHRSTCEPWCGEDGKKLCTDVHPGRSCCPALGHYCSPECSAEASVSRKK